MVYSIMVSPTVLFDILSWPSLYKSSFFTSPLYIPQSVTCQGASTCVSGFLTLIVGVCENDRNAINKPITAMILNSKQAYRY